MHNIIIEGLEVIVDNVQEANTVIALFVSDVATGVISYEEFLELYGVKKTSDAIYLKTLEDEYKSLGLLIKEVKGRMKCKVVI